MADPYGTPGLPLGVAVLAVIVAVIGVLSVLGGLVVLVALLLHAGTGLVGTLIAGTWLDAALTVVFGLVLLAIALGLWNQELWALVIAILAVIAFLAGRVGYPIYQGASVSSTLLTIPALFALLLFVYLLAVHRHFY